MPKEDFVKQPSTQTKFSDGSFNTTPKKAINLENNNPSFTRQNPAKAVL